MAKLLLGKPVADAIYQQIDSKKNDATLALIRVGDDPASVSYENMLVKKANEHNIDVRQCHLDANVSDDDFFEEIDHVSSSDEVSGFIIFQPLPSQIDVSLLKKFLSAEKDIDCVSERGSAAVYVSKNPKFAPATALSVVEILNFYEIDVAGKNVVIVGRSEVVGKPLSMLLLNKNATVTIAHSHTCDLCEITKRADVVVLATGRAKAYGADYFSEGQVVIDVGTNVDDDGNLVGDVDFETVEPVVGAITPVPRGVGSVTTSVLLRAVCRASQ